MVKKFISILTLFNITLSSFLFYLITALVNPPIVLADQVCQGPSGSGVGTSFSGRVGGVALDQAAKFLADMSDITGAYYDQSLDRIVFVGKKNTTLPQFDKDDMAVAIKTIIFERKLPWFSLDQDPSNANILDANFSSPSLMDTKFGKVMFDADYQLKKYNHGVDANGQPVTSSVPGYQSFVQMYLNNGPVPSTGDKSRWWITPQYISLNKDDLNSAFVFAATKMQIKTEALMQNTAPWDKAANDFAQFQTDHFDEFAQESPSYAQIKQIGRIAAVIKWIYDNGITTDFHWARDYAPKIVPTQRTISKFPDINYTFSDATYTYTGTISGGADLVTANTYYPDTTGASAATKQAAQAIPTTKEDIHWQFNKDSQTYDAVAVTADAFRSLGSYNTSQSDFSTPIAGDLNLNFSRAYSSYSGGQYGAGRGWSIYPTRLMDTNPGYIATCSGVNHPYKLGFQSQAGGYESFKFKDCTSGYVAEDTAYHSLVFHNTDNTFTVRLKDQTEYKFDSSYKLVQVKDKDGNTIAYNFDSSNKLINISDTKSHQISFSYNPQGWISTATDWAGRVVSYSYDSQGNLLTVTDPKGGVTTYEYDSNFKLTKATDRLGNIVVLNAYNPDARLNTQKNASDLTKTFSYDEINRVISMADSQGLTQKTKYDAKGRVLENIDALLYSIKYSYGTEFMPLTMTDKIGNITTNTYDSNGNLTSLTFPNSKKITYTYDAKNRVTSITDNRYGLTSKVTTFNYDLLGNLTQKTEAGVITKYTYDSTGEILSTIDPLNHTTSFTRDSLGNALTQTDPLTNITNFQYDSLGRLTQKTDPDSKAFKFGYDNNGNLTSEINAAGTTSLNYDAENRLTQITKPNNAVTQYSYNKADSLTSVKDALNNTTSYGYDFYQNLTNQLDALNNTTSNAYDKLNRQISSSTPISKITKWEYDASGNLTKRTDPSNNATVYAYDNLNRLTKITYPDSKTVNFTYDDRGNRTKMVDSVGTSTFSYDVFDRLISATNPYGNKISYNYNNVDKLTKLTYPDLSAVNYTYDNANNLSSVQDWNLKNTTYTYNKNGSVATKTLPNGIKTTYSYDNANRLIDISHIKGTTTLAKFTYTRDSVGNITNAAESGSFIASPSPSATPTPTPIPTPSASPTPLPSSTPVSTPTPTPSSTPQPSTSPAPSPSGSGPDLVITSLTTNPVSPTSSTYFTISTTYKNQGSVTISAPAVTIAYFYDNPTPPDYLTTYNSFTIRSISLAPGQSTTYNYPYGRFTTKGTHKIYAIIDYDNSVAESNENNNLGGPTSVNIVYINPIQQFLASIFPVANAQTVPVMANSAFSFDLLGRLTKSNYPDGNFYNYTYDKLDNRLSEVSKIGTKNYIYNNDSQMLQGGALTYYYDSSGNTIQKTQTGLQKNPQFSYDFENRLNQLVLSNGNTYKYTYDGLGNRVQKEFVPGTLSRYVVDMSQPLSRLLAETSGYTNGVTGWDVYSLGLISEGDYFNSGRQYYLEDGLGNARFITDYNGNQKVATDYDPFGQIRKNTGLAEETYKFNTQQYDSESDLQFLRARYYDPETGRFLTKDPVKGPINNPRTLNPYAYALNNPIINSDPSGNQTYVETGSPQLDTLEQAALFGAACIVGAYQVAKNPALIGQAISSISTLLKSNNSSNSNVNKNASINPADWVKNNFNNPSAKPGEGWKWRGSGPEGGDQGAWYNPEADVSLHPDINNTTEGPHWDVTEGNSPKVRIGPDGKPL